MCLPCCVQGRTHASSPLAAEDGSLGGVVWETPLDVLLATSSAQHWPAIVFKLFSRSIWLGRYSPHASEGTWCLASNTSAQQRFS
jgi:hypothetical protein